MKKWVLLTVATLCMAGMAFGSLGQVVASFPNPGVNCRGLARSNDVLFSVDQNRVRIYLMNSDTGSVLGSFAPAGGSSYVSGLCYQSGGYLWQNQAWGTPYRFYRTNATNGSIYNYYLFPSRYWCGSAPLATGDGGAGTSYIICSNYYGKSMLYMTTTGSIARGHTVPQPLYDIAYDWRNELIWGGMDYYSVYGVSTQGSIVASFTRPSANVRGMTYHGQYLWVAGSGGYIYKVHCPYDFVNVAPSSVGKVKALFR